MFADVNDRTKGAMEKAPELVRRDERLRQGQHRGDRRDRRRSPPRASSRSARTPPPIAKKSFETATAALKTLADGQVADRVHEAAGRLRAHRVRPMVAADARARPRAMLKLAGEVAQPISNRVAIAAEKIKIAA